MASKEPEPKKMTKKVFIPKIDKNAPGMDSFMPKTPRFNKTHTAKNSFGKKAYK